jgi:hypothetical protein
MAKLKYLVANGNLATGNFAPNIKHTKRVKVPRSSEFGDSHSKCSGLPGLCRQFCHENGGIWLIRDDGVFIYRSTGATSQIIAYVGYVDS